MMKKILILALSALALNLFALDVYDTMILTDNATINDDVHVHPGGVIQNDGFGSYTLTVNGNLINEGSIQNSGGYSLSVTVNGSLDNQGSISCHQINLGGSSPAFLSASSPIASSYLFVTNTNGITASGDINLNTRSDFNRNVLDMNGYDLSIDNHYIAFVSITAGIDSDITLSNSCYFSDVTLTDGNLYGDAEIYSSVDFYGTVVNYGTLQNMPYATVDLDVYGTLDNRGTVRNNAGGYSLNIVSYGDIINRSIWINNLVETRGTAPQTLYMYDSSVMSPTHFQNFNETSIIAGTDLSFVNCKIDLNDSGYFNLTNADLSVNGQYLYRGTIAGTPEYTEINLSGDAFIEEINASNVVLTGIHNISVGVNFSGNVINNGTLQNFQYATSSLNVNGTLDNRGTIRNNAGGYSLIIISYGDLINRSTWINNQIEMRGTAPQTLYMYDLSAMSPTYFQNFNETSIIAGTDLNFLNCKIDFNNIGSLDIATNFANLNFDGEYFYRGTILSAENAPPAKSYPSITGSNGFYLESSTINNVALYGTINVWGGVIFEDAVFNYGTLQNESNGSYSITVNGSFTNYGTVQNGISYGLFIDQYGPAVMNEGIWNNAELRMYGSSPQQIYCGGALTPFSPGYFRNYNPTSIDVMTDLYFENTKIDLNDSGYVDLTNANLFVKGEYLYRGTIVGTAGSTEINLSGDAYIEEINASDVTLTGTHNVWGGVNLSGEIVNNAVLQNSAWASYTMYIDGNITNNAAISNASSYSLYMELTGDLINNGSISNYSLKFTGSSSQHISSPDSVVAAATVYSSNANPVVFDSDVTFVSSAIDLDGSGGFDLSGGRRLGLDGGYLYMSNITGGPGTGLHLSDNAYLQHVTVNGDLVFSGNVRIDEGVSVSGNVVNNGTIENSFYSQTLEVAGDFQNNGIVQNYGGYSLYLNITGDLTNEGTLTNYVTRMNGTTDQYVNLLSPVNSSYFYLISELGTSPFQWYKDSEALDLAEVYGEDQQEMYFSGVEIDSTYFGTYYCQTGEGPSRNIIFRKPVYAAPVITGVYHTGEYMVVQWDIINDADHYDIYSSADPYADPATWAYEGSQNNTPTKPAWIEWIDMDPSEAKKFYFVKAVY